MTRALYAIHVGGLNVTANFDPLLISLRVSDNAGQASATAAIELDDTGGQVVMPKHGAALEIFLGWQTEGVTLVFSGKVDDVRARGSRGAGRTLSIGAKEADVLGPSKSTQAKHFDDKTVKEILTEAGKSAGVTDVRVDEALASVKIPYVEMRDESFSAFGRRLAAELGATFKLVGTRATMTARNGAGMTFPSVVAAWGRNLHDYDIAPFLGRPRFKKTRARYYDRKQGKVVETEVETDLKGVEADTTEKFFAADEAEAKRKVKSHKAESERGSGEGYVTLEGEVGAQPEGECQVIGARPGIDGSYRIDGVEHSYSRSSGFVTRLDLKRPSGSAGADARGAE